MQFTHIAPARGALDIGGGGGLDGDRSEGETSMQAGEAIAEILKREGVEIIFGYPVNHMLELAASGRSSCAGSGSGCTWRTPSRG